MTATAVRATLDTNIAVYALTDSQKTAVATSVLRQCAFLSVQVLNEYANYTVRKQKRTLAQAANELEVLGETVSEILPIDHSHNREALRIAGRYRLSFYDSLMIAVALAGGAAVLYSEDMQHGLAIDGRLTITNPFLVTDLI